jgi:hypothetical protein
MACQRWRKAVAGGVDLHAPVALELSANDLMVPFDQIAPALVSRRCGARGAPNDIGEQERREETLSLDHGVDVGIGWACLMDMQNLAVP